MCVTWLHPQDFYLSLRASSCGGISSSLPITARQLESLVRLAEARARAELRELVTADDALVRAQRTQWCGCWLVAMQWCCCWLVAVWGATVQRAVLLSCCCRSAWPAAAAQQCAAGLTACFCPVKYGASRQQPCLAASHAATAIDDAAAKTVRRIACRM